MLTLLSDTGTHPSQELVFQDASTSTTHPSAISGPASSPGFSSGGCRQRSFRSHSGAYFFLAALASIAAVVMLIKMCIKGRGGYPHAGRRLAEDSDSDSVFAATCEAWLDDDSESEPSEEEPDTSPGTASSSISLESPQGKVESPDQAKRKAPPAGGPSDLRGHRISPPPPKRGRMEVSPPPSRFLERRVTDESEDQAASDFLVQEMDNEPLARTPALTSRAFYNMYASMYMSDRELGTALKYLSRVEFPGEGASQDVVVEQEYTGANEQAWMRVVRTVDPTTDPWSNVLPAGVFLPSQLWETEEAEPGPSAKDETSKSDVPETSPQPSTSGAGVSSQSDAPEKPERPVPQSIRRPTASQTSTAAPLLLSRVNNDTHPFFRLPSADTSGYRVHFSPDTSALSREGARIVHPLLIEVRRKLIKQALTKEDLVELAGLAEKLMANLLFFHEYELPSAPSRLVEALGKRFLALDALVSVLEVLGVERQGTWWASFAGKIRHEPSFYSSRRPGTVQEAFHKALVEDLVKAMVILKSGDRPSSNLTVSIKRRLFCSRNTDRYYRRPWFNPWRQDDREFLISQEQQQQKKE